MPPRSSVFLGDMLPRCGRCELYALAGTLFTLFWAPLARAECQPSITEPGNATLTEDQADAQARTLAAILADEAKRARTWRLAWTGVNGASTVAPLAVLPIVSTDTRLDL